MSELEKLINFAAKSMVVVEAGKEIIGSIDEAVNEINGYEYQIKTLQTELDKANERVEELEDWICDVCMAEHPCSECEIASKEMEKK